MFGKPNREKVVDVTFNWTLKINIVKQCSDFCPFATYQMERIHSTFLCSILFFKKVMVLRRKLFALNGIVTSCILRFCFACVHNLCTIIYNDFTYKRGILEINIWNSFILGISNFFPKRLDAGKWISWF